MWSSQLVITVGYCGIAPQYRRFCADGHSVAALRKSLSQAADGAEEWWQSGTVA